MQTLSAPARLQQIERARRAWLGDGAAPADALHGGPEGPLATLGGEGWIERSWRRCLDAGLRPDHHLEFDMVPREAARHCVDANANLLRVARPVLGKLGRAIANSRYFAILTDVQGVVIDVDGPIDRSDRRAALITRIGVDLSERAVGTTAIGAALRELHPVWLHRGEHFFRDTSVYSCAGAPLFGPDGRCVGMLDLTGVEVAERPELVHLVSQAARSIENLLTQACHHALLLRLNWPGHSLGDESDGLVGLDADGVVTAANQAARQMLAPLAPFSRRGPVHCSDLFAMPWQSVYESARLGTPREVPLWSGLVLQVLPTVPGAEPGPQMPAASPAIPLRDVEAALIRKAVDQARGNVMEAARMLGISRATVYRKLGRKH